MYVKRNIVARSRYHSWGANATMGSICIIYDMHIAVNNTKLFSFVPKTQQWVPSALLMSYKIIRTTVNNINVILAGIGSRF